MMERERLEPLDYTVIQLAANESWLPTDSWADLRGYLIGKEFDPKKVESSKLRLMRLLSDVRSQPPSPPHANGFDLGPNAKSLRRDSETDQPERPEHVQLTFEELDDPKPVYAGCRYRNDTEKESLICENTVKRLRATEVLGGRKTIKLAWRARFGVKTRQKTFRIVSKGVLESDILFGKDWLEEDDEEDVYEKAERPNKRRRIGPVGHQGDTSLTTTSNSKSASDRAAMAFAFESALEYARRPRPSDPCLIPTQSGFVLEAGSSNASQLGMDADSQEIDNQGGPQENEDHG